MGRGATTPVIREPARAAAANLGAGSALTRCPICRPTWGEGVEGVWRGFMTIDVLVLQPTVALIAGILILLIPRILNFVVALYLIIVGVLGLWPHIQ
jgi:hypothetical protein